MLDAAGTYPAKLNSGDSISPSGKWKVVSYDPLNSAGMGNWQASAIDKYLGFRIKNSGSWKYGWLKMSIASGAVSFTVSEWAINIQGDKPINAGQTVATGVGKISAGDDIRIVLHDKQLSFLNLENNTSYKAAITDIQGKVVYSGALLAQQNIDIATMAPGIYIAQLAADGFERYFKIQVQ
jgi:hypothetical protein